VAKLARALAKLSTARLWGTRAFFVAWFVAVSVPAVYQLAEHTLSLPMPVPDKLQAAMMARHDAQRWTVVHVLYSECGCSKRVGDWLTERTPIEGAVERVIVVGDDHDELVTRLRVRGLDVEVTSAQDLVDHYGVVAAPLFVVSAPSGEVRYVGGYTEQKRGPVIRDRGIVEALERGERVEALPVLGCAVSKDLQRRVDPLALKY
jgi:hypothetical protein